MKQKKSEFLPRLTALLGSALIALSGTAAYYAHRLPDHLYADTSRPLTVPTALPVTVTRRSDTATAEPEAELRLFGLLPVKTVTLTPVRNTEVCVGGEPFGVRMQMAGVMVVSLGEVDSPHGQVCPAREAGIAVGDMIEEVGGMRIRGNSDIQQAVAQAEGSAVQVTFRRGDVRTTVAVQPAYARIAKKWQLGLWVRDSVAGIGTVTYYLESPTGAVQFAGLGHAVCDADTGEQIPLAAGDVIGVEVRDIVPGAGGKPGELLGRFGTASMGLLYANTACGVFGAMDALPEKVLRVPLGYRQDVRPGKAEIYTTISGTEPRAYTVEIEELRPHDAAMRDMILRVTDPALLAETGGIVQGMSGSPVIQNGRLVGAVTHVFVRDPTRGYGILAENMYAQTAAYAGTADHAAAAPADAKPEK